MEIEVSVNDMSPAHRASVLGNREELIQILEVKILSFDPYQKAKNDHKMTKNNLSYFQDKSGFERFD